MQGHKKKKPTKKEFVNEILPKHIHKELMKQYLTGCAHGFEQGNKAMLHYINKGHSFEEVKAFIQKNVDFGKDSILRFFENESMKDFEQEKDNIN